jgi:hypothetical protein
MSHENQIALLPEEINSNAPVLVCYVKNDNSISKSYIVSKRKTVSKLKACNVEQSLALLLGTYYTFNLEFPQVSDLFLRFLDQTLGNQQVKKEPARLKKFLKVYNDTNSEPLNG